MRRYRSKKQPSPILPLLFVLIVFAGILSIFPFLNLTVLNIEALLILGIAGIVFVLLGGSAFIFYIDAQNRKRIRALEMSQIDKMLGVEFEKYVGELIKFQGYKIEFTPGSNDYGVDIVARRDHHRYAIQIKRYKNMLDNTPIQEAIAGMKHYNCDRSLVVTNNYFTKNAQNLAKTNECILIDRDILTEWILAFQEQRNIKKLF